jgi:hypothetical protein
MRLTRIISVHAMHLSTPVLLASELHRLPCTLVINRPVGPSTTPQSLLFAVQWHPSLILVPHTGHRQCRVFPL